MALALGPGRRWKGNGYRRDCRSLLRWKLQLGKDSENLCFLYYSFCLLVRVLFTEVPLWWLNQSSSGENPNEFQVSFVPHLVNFPLGKPCPGPHEGAAHPAHPGWLPLPAHRGGGEVSALSALTFHLLLGSSGVTGGTGHADIVPVDVLEKDLSVPPCQGAGLRETRCEAPHISPGLVGARDLRHWRRVLVMRLLGLWGNRAPGQLPVYAYSSSNAISLCC